MRTAVTRPLGIGLAGLLLLAGMILGSTGTAAATSFTASLGSHGGARWTPGTSVYVNLKAMTPGTWKQQLWSGSCAVPGTRLAVLPGLVVPSTRVLAKTTTRIPSIMATDGVTLRLLLGSTVVCGAFVRPPAPSGSPSPSPTPTPLPAASALHGVNVVGMEMSYLAFDRATGPVAGTNYPVHDTRLIDYLASKHVSAIRFLFSWEGMQSELFGPVPAAPAGAYRAYYDNYRRIVDYATAKGIRVIVEPWQANAGGGAGGAMWRGQLVGSAAVPVTAFADFWAKMAPLFAGNALVSFGLVNEPNAMSTMQWWTAAQAAVTAIRQAGATQPILVPGNGYTAASQWTNDWYDTDAVPHSNAYGWLNAGGPGKPLADPLDNTVVEVHTYLDPNESGSSTEISSVTAARTHLANVVGEARARGYRVFLGEIGMWAGQTTDDARPASAAWADFVAYAKANTDTLLGWTWWATGAPGWWDDVAANGGGHFATTPTDGATFTGDTVNMTMIQGDF